VRVIKLSQAMGSFNNPLNRIVSRIFLPALCERIYARGKVTVSHLEDLQIKPRLWDYAPDVALLYRSEYSLSDENPALLATQIETLTQLKSEGKTIIALSPSSVVFQQMHKTGEDYLAIFLKIIRDLSSSYHYLIVPNATRESSSKMRNNDIIIIDQLRRRAERELPAGSWKRLHSVLYDINTAGSRDLLGFADVMVTSRFHGLISALSLALPVCVIGWSHKYLEILTEFGMEDFAIDYSEVDQTLSGVIQDLLDNAQDWHDKIAQRLPHVQALSQKQFDQLELDT
jgi:colanic acid/amylovoran biosynthesis protein